MYSEASLARLNRRLDSANQRHLAIVDAASEQNEVALSVEALSKHYGDTEAVSQVSFDVRQGEVFGLLGLNGAGKTTLISMLAAERRPSAGTGWPRRAVAQFCWAPAAGQRSRRDVLGRYEAPPESSGRVGASAE